MIRWYAIFKNNNKWNKSAYFVLIRALQDYMKVRKTIMNGSKLLGYPDGNALVKKPVKFGQHDPKVKKLDLFKNHHEEIAKLIDPDGLRIFDLNDDFQKSIQSRRSITNVVNKRNSVIIIPKESDLIE